MHPDDENAYRPALEKEPPLFFDRVNTPWDDVPDLEEYNQAAYRRIVRTLQSVKQRQTNRDMVGTEGLLILGEAGTGKTHLLMRVARTLSDTNHILFVRRPPNEEAVTRHIWAEMVTSLAKPVFTANGTRSQLDDLLAHVFSAVLIPEFEADIAAGTDAERRRRWVEKLRADPYHLFTMLGTDAQRQKNLDPIRRRTLRHLQQQHPGVDQHIAHGLITYCLYARENDKRILLTWLAGEEQDPDDTKRLGLPDAWGHGDAQAESADVGKRREDKALKAIRTIGTLSTYYQPLILAFDQLEGLRDNRPLTEAWGDTVREIFTQVPNLLVLTCIFPSLWHSWFAEVCDQSVRERIAPGTPIELERFSANHGRKMLAKHLETSVSRHQLPSDIYPFTDTDVAALCAAATSPRTFLQAARVRFEAWLDGKLSPTTPEPSNTHPTIPIPADEIDKLLREKIRSFERDGEEAYRTQLLIEHEFFGRVRVILESLLAEAPDKLQYTRATCGTRVMPPNLVVQAIPGGLPVCIAVSNAEGNSFTACVRNLLAVLREGKQARSGVLLRDRRSRTITGQVAQQHLAELEQYGGEYLILGKDEVILLNAIYDTLIAAEEQDLSIGTRLITRAEFVRFLGAERVGRRSVVLAAVASLIAPLAAQLGLDTPEAVNSGAPAAAAPGP